jgi:hypothetical protein
MSLPQNIPVDFDVRDLAPKGRPDPRLRVVDHARALAHYTAMLAELEAQLAEETS